MAFLRQIDLRKPWSVKFIHLEPGTDDPSTTEGWERIVGKDHQSTQQRCQSTELPPLTDHHTRPPTTHFSEAERDMGDWDYLRSLLRANGSFRLELTRFTVIRRCIRIFVDGRNWWRSVETGTEATPFTFLMENTSFELSIGSLLGTLDSRFRFVAWEIFDTAQGTATTSSE